MNEDVNKNYYPIKLLFDEKMKPFVPLVTVDCVLVQGTDKSAQDLFDERYTKAEVDKIIADLGTLQRLCGTLNTYHELQAIENPKPGDTYIVKNTNTSGNYQEYMYIGSKWEELGPFVDLSNYATHSDVDAKITAYNDTIRSFIAAEDAGVLEAAKAFVIEKMEGADNLDLEVSKTSNVTTLRIYRKDGSIEEVQIIDGEKGDPGITPNLQVGTVTASEPGSMPSITRSGSNENPYFNFIIPRGEQGPEGPKGETPDLSDYVKFVNGVSPDENGNVIIAGETEDECFKVYRVKDGVSNSQYSSSRYSYTLTDECLSTIQTMIANYLEGERNGVLVIDTANILYLSDNLCFIINESKSTPSKIVFQSLITPTDKLSVSGNTTTGVSTLCESSYGMDVTWENGTIGTYTCYKSNTNVQGGSFATLTTVTSANLTITGLHTYNKLPQSSVEPTDDKDLVNKAYVDSLGGGGASGDVDGLQEQVNKIQEKIDNGFMVLGDDDLQALWSALGITVDYINTAMLYLGYGCGAFQIMSDTFKFRFDSGTSYTFKKGTIIIVTGRGRITYVLVNGDDPDLYMTYHTVTPKKYTSYPSKVYRTYTTNYLWLDALSKLSYTPTENHHTATKQYVDNAVTTALGAIESLLSEV